MYIHSAQHEVETKFERIVQLILRQKEIAKFVNENCITYGMFDNSDDYELIQKYIPLKNLPAFALFKLNKAKRAEEFISDYVIMSLFRKYHLREKSSWNGQQRVWESVSRKNREVTLRNKKP